jgi:predicted nuclease of restriction endonuclease-like RecB superfamily
MLERTHVAPFTRERAGRIEIDYLRDPDGRVVAFLDRLVRLARRLEGRPAGVLREALRRQERRVRDARRLAGIGKTLMDACELRQPPGAHRAEEVRLALFHARGRIWPPAEGDADAPYETVGREMGIGAAEVHRILYADQPAARVLARAPGWDGKRLLDRYNLELARGVLRDATRVVITARGGWKDIFRAVKLARLMYRIERAGKRSWRVELTGPAAAYISRPQRYGIRLARVVPALTRAAGWKLDADLLRDGRPLGFRLDGAAPIGRRRRGRPARYDSSWERSLAEEFAGKIGAERGGWTLTREDTPVTAGGSVFLPDFSLRHADGREALVEVVGFWTPEYLQDKLRKVREAGLDNLVLAVYRKLGVGEAEFPDEAEVVWFANRPAIGPVLEAAERVARPHRRAVP